MDDQLLVGFSGAKKGKAVQKLTISRWIVLCIKICYALAKKQLPGGLWGLTTRTKDVTTALAHGVPIPGHLPSYVVVAPYIHEAVLSGQPSPQDGHFAHSVLQDLI